MTPYEVQHQLGKKFHACLTAGDWEGIRGLLTDDATWTLPGDNTISGTAVGAEAVVERAKKIASYGLDFELLHILVSRENMALSLHNTARRARSGWTSTSPPSAASATARSRTSRPTCPMSPA